MNRPTKIPDIPACPTCKYCVITTSGQSGEYGQDVWIKHYCVMHMQPTGEKYTCLKHETK